jgi:SAM-dependent methyltransferase
MIHVDYSIIDVGCGTGIYLEAQVEHFGNATVTWVGQEPSGDMLDIAVPKVPTASFVKAPAEAVPFLSDTFDVLLTSFAFHHFIDKLRALDEFARILRPGGVLRYANITPEKMPGWVYYRFFPETRENDLERFWTADRFETELVGRALETTVNIDLRRTQREQCDVLEEFRNRDASQLWTITESEYQEGLAMAERELSNEAGVTIDDEMAMITVEAVKRS